MKILYFSRSYTPHDHRFLSAIVDAGHEAFFLRLQNAATEDRSLPNGVNEISGKLETVTAKVEPDLIHAGPLPTCGYLAAKSGFHPLVLMSWGSDILWEARRNPFARARTRFALNKADVVIGDCQAVRDAVIAFGVSHERIVTFPWGIYLARFTPDGGDGGLRAKLGWQNNFVLLHLRSWEPLYDPLTVARAFVLAAKQEPNLRLLMPGAGSLEAKIRRVFARGGVLDRVHMLGQIPQAELPNYYRASDIYISASQSDGSSVSLMEALACGLPVLVSDTPGNREWVQEGKQGWLFRTGEYKQLAILELNAVRDKNLNNIGRAARVSAEKKADWDRNKKELLSAYSRVIKGRDGKEKSSK